LVGLVNKAHCVLDISLGVSTLGWSCVVVCVCCAEDCLRVTIRKHCWVMVSRVRCGYISVCHSFSSVASIWVVCSSKTARIISSTLSSLSLDHQCRVSLYFT